MTREEAITKYIVPAIEKTWNDKRCKEILEALEQEPCEDEYIKVPKKALKYRTAGMVAYNAEWLKNHFDIEKAVICGVQQPCDDVVSRRAAIEIARSNIHYGLDKEYEYSRELLEKTMAEISSLPPVTPQPKTGHWIAVGDYFWKCSECKCCEIKKSDWCPSCGAMMKEVEE